MTSPSGGPPSLTIGQAVGQAEASLTRLLTAVLAKRRTSRPTYLALQRLNSLGGHATPDAYERDLSQWLGLDGPGAKALAGELTERHLTEADDREVRLTEQGRALREDILTEGAQTTSTLLTGLDASDVETTIRTLQEITTRATRAASKTSTTPEGIRMTTQNLPGTDAARHGTGDADLTIMIAAHDAFRRDLTRLARAASAANDPARRQSVHAGWELFKRELHLHHTAEDEIIWPALRPRLARSEHAMDVLAAMEAEHELIDPLLAAVDAAFASQEPAADVIGALTSTLTGHLAHEERDGLPLIGTALTAAQWRGVGRKIARKNGLPAGSEMFAWLLDGADRDHRKATLAQLPPPLRLLYRTRWKPRFAKTPRW